MRRSPQRFRGQTGKIPAESRIVHRRGILLLNPNAGAILARGSDDLLLLAQNEGLEVVEIRPGLDLHAVVGDALRRGLRDIIVAGGDGTLHHAAQAIVKTEAIMGVLPAGTLNHFAHDLGIPLDLPAALDIALRGSVRQIDTGQAGEHYFLNSLMLGMYPAISKYREQYRLTRGRWSAYALAGREALREFPKVTVILEMEHRIETVRAEMFAVAINAYDLSRAGLLVPKTTLDDGQLSIYSLSSKTRVDFMLAVAKYLRGHVGSIEGFRHFRSRRLRIDSPHRLRVALDGELRDMKPPITVSAVPASLLVRVP